MKRPLKTKKSGFTLIELLVVIAIMAVMAVGTAPILQNSLSSTRVEWALEDVASMSRYCQRYAMATKRWCRVTFRTSDDEARLHDASDEANNTGWVQMKHPTTGANFEVNGGSDAYVDVDITAVNIDGSNSFMFDEYGVPHDRGTIGNPGDLPAPITSVGTVTYNGSSGWQLQIQPQTGKIDIVDLP